MRIDDLRGFEAATEAITLRSTEMAGFPANFPVLEGDQSHPSTEKGARGGFRLLNKWILRTSSDGGVLEVLLDGSEFQPGSVALTLMQEATATPPYGVMANLSEGAVELQLRPAEAKSLLEAELTRS